jgi:hypothetical protein
LRRGVGAELFHEISRAVDNPAATYMVKRWRFTYRNYALVACWRSGLSCDLLSGYLDCRLAIAVGLRAGDRIGTIVVAL